jgi:hypothetical protein
MKETDMLVDAGLDAVVFLRFLRMCRWLWVKRGLGFAKTASPEAEA